ncbi:hypothetical protein LTR62_003163 [Meristemomyces frigidus]|uniref:Uncharacterized protein n=1 Tax=Meristemomyces frigidus TaxID=1508187 RepID=A0AAN7YPV4_9PEZI|nr:hypothetical protein LTR62_003163 [Meristemomyces frigidus]
MSRPASSYITDAQREDAAEQWRVSPQAEAMSPEQCEDVAQQILNGAADVHLERNNPNVTQVNFAGAGMSPDLQLQSPYSGLPFPSMPGFPLIPPMPGFLPMPPMPSMQPSPTVNNSPAMAPFPPPTTMGFPSSVGTAPSFSRTLNVPGGVFHQSGTNYSGPRGNTHYGYSSSITTAHCPQPALMPPFNQNAGYVGWNDGQKQDAPDTPPRRYIEPQNQHMHDPWGQQ